MKYKRNHIVVWLILLAYLLTAARLHLTFFQKYGKPAASEEALPAPTSGIVYQFAPLEIIQYNGEELYQLSGYAFRAVGLLAESQEAEYQAFLVLHSAREDLVFQTIRVPDPKIVITYKKYTPALDWSEFHVLIAKDALKIDRYEIGILLQEKDGQSRIYQLTDRFIVRSPNILRLSQETR